MTCDPFQLPARQLVANDEAPLQPWRNGAETSLIFDREPGLPPPLAATCLINRCFVCSMRRPRQPSRMGLKKHTVAAEHKEWFTLFSMAPYQDSGFTVRERGNPPALKPSINPASSNPTTSSIWGQPVAPAHSRCTHAWSGEKVEREFSKMRLQLRHSPACLSFCLLACPLLYSFISFFLYLESP